MLLADFHLHSKYSRATSPLMNVIDLGKAAKEKGINLLGTGDFTHPLYFAELKKNLSKFNEGIFIEEKSGTKFIPTTEICLIFGKEINNVRKVRKVHLLIFSENFEIVEQINDWLSKKGNLKADGRPIFGMNAVEFTEKIMEISKENFIVPAHCILPDTFLHCNSDMKMIKNISVGDLVYTHKGQYQKVQKVYRHRYKGEMINIKPYYFRIGLKTTPEHPICVIKTFKDCSNFGGQQHVYCRRNCSYLKRRGCKHPYFMNYRSEWVQAKDIEKGDVLVFPRFNTSTEDVKEIRISNYLSERQFKVLDNEISCNQGRTDKKLPNIVNVDKNFCRLGGYYISEGYTNNRDSIAFCFNQNEEEYVKDLNFLMKKIFKFSSPRIYKRKKTKSIEIIYFSKILSKVFGTLFYNSDAIKKANTKCLPFWMLTLPLEKQVEILTGWWRGDTGYTSSREMMNQMKIILLRLGIVPSIGKQTKEYFNKSKKHKIGNRTIKAQGDLFSFYNLSFFQDSFELLKTPEFRKFNTKLDRRHGWIDEKYIYIPVRDIGAEDYEGEVYNLEVEEDNSYVCEFAAVHNCWTPWFGILGSKSGFDSIEECFEDKSKEIYAVETGLSSDPLMNWQLSKLDKYALISNSDSHSLHNLGRECNAFNFDEEYVRYKDIINAIKFKNKEKFLFTVEVPPEFGKYHYTGHRSCNFSCAPKEAINLHNLCPICKNPLTIGVEQRVEELADREHGFIPLDAIPFKNIIPLWEICGKFKVKNKEKILINKFNNEMNVLLNAEIDEIRKIDENVAIVIESLRNNKHIVKPGYDGVYGEILTEGGNKGKESKEKEKNNKGKEKEKREKSKRKKQKRKRKKQR